jgi:bacillithiol biosynthesis cysteine-adding enzyme BshC
MNDSGCTRPVSVRNVRTESIPFSAIPNQSRLFLDHQNDPTILRQFYPTSVISPVDVAGRVDEVLANYRVDRDELCESLVRINHACGAPSETFANIEILREKGTVAVLTGQQTGLFTGPLYSIYKALTAIRMAECLRSKGIKAVPVFWMATEDHDLAEVSRVAVIDRDNKLFEANFDAEGVNEGSPVGAVQMNGSVTSAIDEILAAMPATDHSSGLKKDLLETWSNGKTFGEAFGSFLLRLLGRFGLMVVDPLDNGLKKLASPLYADAVRKSAEIVNSLVKRNGDLAAAGYHAQVLVEDDYFPLFWHTDGGVRTPLRRTHDGRFQPKGYPASFTDVDLLEVAASDPARLSPGVMLRPVVQDHLFPTICYFGGSAEIAYFAQNSEVYRVLERPVTPILHRQSFTVVEAKHARTLKKYGLAFSDLFKGEEPVIRRVIDESIDPETATLFAESQDKINMQLDLLDQTLSKLDPTLAANLATRRRKIIYHIGALQKKYYSRRAVTEEVIDRRIKGAFTALLPGGQLQERVVNIASFLDRYGPGFVDLVYDSIDLEDQGHRVIFI